MICCGSNNKKSNDKNKALFLPYATCLTISTPVPLTVGARGHSIFVTQGFTDKDYTFYESIISTKFPGSPREGSKQKESHVGDVCPLRNGTQLLKQVPWPCLMSM